MSHRIRFMEETEKERNRFSPWLIQRLRVVDADAGPPVELSDIGESDKLREYRQQVFGYDYMGASEFEFGALPEAMFRFHENVKKGNVVEITSDVRFHHVLKVWYPESQSFKEIPVSTDQLVYILSPKDIAESVEPFIHLLADEREPINLKESPHFDEAVLRCKILEEAEKHETGKNIYVGGNGIGGWFCIDKGREFFFFTDLIMFEHTKLLFGIDSSPKPTVDQEKVQQAAPGGV